jgi:hypothetical protein
MPPYKGSGWIMYGLFNSTSRTFSLVVTATAKNQAELKEKHHVEETLIYLFNRLFDLDFSEKIQTSALASTVEALSAVVFGNGT